MGLKYEKIPVVVDACQWHGPGLSDEFHCWAKEQGFPIDFINRGGAIVFFLHGIKTRAQKQDWIIKGVEGEFYPCTPTIFEKTHKLVTTKK